MEKGYEVKQLVYNRLHATHIPYFVAAIIKGPKGAYYVVDEFTLEIMLKAKSMNLYHRWIQDKTCLVPRVDVRFVCVKDTKTSDDTVRAVRRIYDKVLLKRTQLIIRDNSDRVRNIGKQLEIKLENK